ncbi:MAG: SPOR domain-containing protein, partial [Acidimicrobiales bacterium]
ERHRAPPWTVQLAAYGSLVSALEHADAITAAGRTAIVTPVMLSPSRTIWYRVCEGLYATRDDARKGRALLRRQGLTRTGDGIPLLAPYSLTLGDTAAPRHLRELGIPGFRWADDPRLLAGVFETPDQAAYAEAQLASAGRFATLIARTGAKP